MNDDTKFTPNLQQLQKELGRQPEAPKSRPEDYAPKPATLAGRANLSQGIKDLLHDSPNWRSLGNEQREALERIATEISYICCGLKDFAHWAAIADLAKLED